MRSFGDYLLSEWNPALGCTEPASIAYAASKAASLVEGEIQAVHLRCDPRMFKNCYAVGIPNSGHKMGIRWALAIGSLLPNSDLQLEVFRQTTPSLLEAAGQLIHSHALTVEVDSSQTELLVDCSVIKSRGKGRVVIQKEHTHIVRLEKSGKKIPLEAEEKSFKPQKSESVSKNIIRKELAQFSFEELLAIVQTASSEDRENLRKGADLNIAISRHGLTLFPRSFLDLNEVDPLTRISRMVCAGVYARMCGEDFLVMSLAGSGNKGIVVSVPIILWGKEIGAKESLIEEALGLACLMTSASTFHLGVLSAACGCSNAAGLGLAAGLVVLEGGGSREISMAVNNVVGNVTGMICDGAKMGCALKTMTSVDAAFRASSLAMEGIGIPQTDGIVGKDGLESLTYLGRITGAGMSAMDEQILQIMQAKLREL